MWYFTKLENYKIVILSFQAFSSLLLGNNIPHTIIMKAFFFFFSATLAAYRSFQAGGPIEPTPQQHGIPAMPSTYTIAHRQHQTLNPLRGARGRTLVLVDTSQVCYHRATTETPWKQFSIHQSKTQADFLLRLAIFNIDFSLWLFVFIFRKQC